MIATVVFLPAVFLSLNALLLIVLCCLGIRIKFVSGPATLVLVSSVLAFAISIEVLLLKIEKAFAIPLIPKDHWILLTTINRYTDLSSRLLFVLGAAWLLVIVIRYKQSEASVR
jgi:hypothetical protein